MLEYLPFSKTAKNALHKKASGMEINLVAEGVKFMVLGMTTVFLFLLLMVGVLQVQSAVIRRFFPQKPISKPSPSGGTPTQSSENATLIAVVSAAIQTFRNQQRH
jgi:oxaloacetate decarboxylase gamma subunit